MRGAWFGAAVFAFACACADAGASAGAGASGGAGAGTGVAGPAGAGGSACDAARDVFPLLCGSSVCHDGSVNGLDLVAPGVGQRLLDVPAAGVNCAASGLLLIDSQRPERSLLLAKLTEQPPCGSPMPLGSGPAGLTQAQLACVEEFVAALSR